MKHHDYYYEDTKDYNDETIITNQTKREVNKNLLNNKENKMCRVNLNNSEGKINNNNTKNSKIFIIDNKKKNNNELKKNEIKSYIEKEKGKKIKNIEVKKDNLKINKVYDKSLINSGNMPKYYKLFKPFMKKRKSEEYLSSSIDNKDIYNNRMSQSDNNKKNNEIVNFIYEKEYLQKQKPTLNNNKNNIPLINKKIIPKIKIIKLITNENYNKLQKNFSTLNINYINNLKLKSRNIFVNKYKNK